MFAVKNRQFTFQKALVTGGGGFIGSHLVEKLLDLNVQVICLDNFSVGKRENIESFKDHKLLKVVQADVTKFDDILPCFQGVDIVFHQAVSKNTVSLKNPIRDLRVNAEGTFNVLEASRIHGVKKIVHASTGSVYGEPVYFPEDEKHPTNPVSFYGTSKLAAEKYCLVFRQLYNMDISILRYFHVYGPRQDDSDVGGVVPIFIRRVLNDLPPIIYGDGTQLRSFTYVEDVVKANLLVAAEPRTKGEIYNCASGLKVTIQQLADLILKKLHKEYLKVQYSDWKPGDIKYFDIDNRKIKDIGMEFEWDLEKGIDSTIQWMIQKKGY